MNFIILIMTLTTLLTTSSSTVTSADIDIAIPSPSPPAPGGCADSVISFSPCLPYISAPPNDLSDEPSSQCCDVFNGSFDSGDADCLCYLVRQTSILGFPLNATKLLSLSDLCFVNDSTARGNNTLDSICSGSPTLPPLIDPTKKPRSGSNAPPHSPPPQPLHPIPPSTTTKPSPANDASRQNTTKPSASKKSSGNHLTLANAIALMPIYLVFVQILISI
ncbi:Bifunctional inhibitor/plant lipid transfer protein/seed storage helical domain-containing protein [Artemisia annua]|uniref:Bifunctional inhibitor/plant lipid transfer protein/seed storage helical domain-containing protein n=1 Tax=Artemisia annua TaxID=35608 RepID=A0A2U1NIF0_ARTAN|nr:Bifunctional inhibitor/plant lipid transfer protein/seed storage helical domain-containing protein [Artemisia annua]